MWNKLYKYFHKLKSNPNFISEANFQFSFTRFCLSNLLFLKIWIFVWKNWRLNNKENQNRFREKRWTYFIFVFSPYVFVFLEYFRCYNLIANLISPYSFKVSFDKTWQLSKFHQLISVKLTNHHTLSECMLQSYWLLLLTWKMSNFVSKSHRKYHNWELKSILITESKLL